MSNCASASPPPSSSLSLAYLPYLVRSRVRTELLSAELRQARLQVSCICVSALPTLRLPAQHDGAPSKDCSSSNARDHTAGSTDNVRTSPRPVLTERRHILRGPRSPSKIKHKAPSIGMQGLSVTAGVSQAYRHQARHHTKIAASIEPLGTVQSTGHTHINV